MTGLQNKWFLVLAVLGVGLAILVAVLAPAYLRNRTEQRVRAEGELATARIMAVQQTGVIINDQQQARIDLLVMHPTRGNWPASFLRVMGVQEIQAYMPGRVLDVRFDPANPTVVAPVP